MIGRQEGKDSISQGFSQVLTSQLSSINLVVFKEHERIVSILRTENLELRQRLASIESEAPNKQFSRCLVDIDSGLSGQLSASDIRCVVDIETGISVERRDHPVRTNVQSVDLSGSLPAVDSSPQTRESEGTFSVTSPNRVFSRNASPKSHRSIASQTPSSSSEPQSLQTPRRGSRNGVRGRKAAGITQSIQSQGSAASTDSADRSTLVQRIVLSSSFELLSGAIILANTLVMSLRLQYDGFEIGFDIGYRTFDHPADEVWPHAKVVFFLLDIVFNIIFIIELALRIIAGHWKALHSGWTWFDAVVITVSAVDTFGSGLLPLNPGMLRLLRLVRLIRLLKILKAMQAFDSLFLLLKAIVASFSAAVWSFAILISVQVVVGLFLNQLLQTLLFEDDFWREASERKEVYRYFGTLSTTMLTMFEITMANWAKPCRILVEYVNEWFILFFILYRCFFCFAVLKVIAAVFIAETNRVLQHDDELTLMKLHRERAMFDKKVRTLVTGFAGETLGWDELTELAYDPEVVALLSTFGFHSQDLEKLFWLIDDGSGTVAVDLFLAKVGALKGGARTIDVLTLLKLARKIDFTLSQALQEMGYLKIDEGEEEIEEHCCTLVSSGQRPRNNSHSQLLETEEQELVTEEQELVEGGAEHT